MTGGLTQDNLCHILRARKLINRPRLEMSTEIQRNLGEQPIARIMMNHGLKAHDLVAASTEHITHKMVSRACKGRRLTPNVQFKILNALNQSAGKTFTVEELFTY